MASSTTATTSSSPSLNCPKYDPQIHDPYCWQCQRKIVPGTDVHCSTCQLSFHRTTCAKKGFPHLFINPKQTGTANNSSKAANICQPSETWELGNSMMIQCRVCLDIQNGFIESRENGLGKVCSPWMVRRIFYYALNTIESKDTVGLFSKIDYPLLCKKQNKPRDCIFRTIDMKTMKLKNEKLIYKSLESFMFDFDLLYHNTKIMFGSNSRRVSQMLSVYNFAVGEVDDIRSCIDCYRYYYECDEVFNEDSFIKPCVKPHAIVWTRHHGFDWPAKVFKSHKPGNIEVRYFGIRTKEHIKPNNVYLYSKIAPSTLNKKNTYDRLNNSKVKKSKQKYQESYNQAMIEVDKYFVQIRDYFKDGFKIPRRPVVFDSSKTRHFFLNAKDHYSLNFRFRNLDKIERRAMIRKHKKLFKLKNKSKNILSGKIVSTKSCNSSSSKLSPLKLAIKQLPKKQNIAKKSQKIPVVVEEEKKKQKEKVEIPIKMKLSLNNRGPVPAVPDEIVNFFVPNKVENRWMVEPDLEPTMGTELLSANCFDFESIESNPELSDLFAKINLQIQQNNRMFAKCVAHEKNISTLKRSIKSCQNVIRHLEPHANFLKSSEWCNACWGPAKFYCCMMACYCSEKCQNDDRDTHGTRCLDKRRRIVKKDSNLVVG